MTTTNDQTQTAPTRRGARALLGVVLLVIGLAAGFAAGAWYTSRTDSEAEWCDRAEGVSRAARAGAPWAEAVDEWSLAQNQPDWANDYNGFEVLAGDDPSARTGTDDQARQWVDEDLAQCGG